MHGMDTSTVGIPIREASARGFVKAPRWTNRDLKHRARLLRQTTVNRVLPRRQDEPFKGDRRFPVPISDGKFVKYFPGQYSREAFNDGGGDVSVSGRIRDHYF